MITVGLAKELLFISRFLQHEISCLFPDFKIFVQVYPNGLLNIWMDDDPIWSEQIDGDTSFFGVESCQTILKIITLKNSGDSSWQKFVYFENQKILDKK